MADEGAPRISLGELRADASSAARRALEPGDTFHAVDALRRLGMSSATSWSLGAGLWQVWGRIHAEWTDPEGDPHEGALLARESAIDLLEAIGDDELERAYCEHWIYERLGE